MLITNIPPQLLTQSLAQRSFLYSVFLCLCLFSSSLLANDDGTLKWTFPVGDTFTNPAIAADGTVYVSGANSTLYAISPSGSLKWKYKTLGELTYTSPSINSNGNVYIGDQNGWIYAFSPTGTLLWSKKYGTGTQVNIALTEEENLVIASLDGNVYSVNASGSLLWQFATGNKIETALAIDALGNIIAANTVGDVFSISPSGQQNWRLATNQGIRLNGLAIDNEHSIYVGNDNATFMKITQSGKLAWDSPVGYAIYSTPVINANQEIFVNESRFFISAYDPQGEWLWLLGVNHSMTFSSMALRDDGSMLVGDEGSGLYAFNDALCLLWMFDSEHAVRSSPAIANDGTIYFTLADGNLYALNGSSPLADAQWPRAGQNNRNTSRVGDQKPTSTPPSIHDNWRFDTQGRVNSDPTITTDGRVYVGSKEGSVFALNTDGSERWRYYTGSTVQASPLYADGVLYVGNNAGEFFALDAQGQRLWSYQALGSISAQAVLHGDQILVSSIAGIVYSFDKQGELNWQYQTQGAIHTSVRVGSDARVYVASDDRHVYALSATGELLWRTQLSHRVVTTPVLDAASQVYVATYDGYFYGLNSQGEIQWSHQAASNLLHQALVLVNDQLIAVGFDGYVTSVSTQGGLRWRHERGAFLAGSVRVVNAESQYLVVADASGKLSRLDLAGNVIWSATLPAELLTAVAVHATSGAIAVGAADGYVYSLVQR